MNDRPPSADFQSRLTVVLKPNGTEMKGEPAGVLGRTVTGAELMNGSPLVAEKSTMVLWLNKIPDGGKTVTTEGAAALAASFFKSRGVRPSTSMFMPIRATATAATSRRTLNVARAAMEDRIVFMVYGFR